MDYSATVAGFAPNTLSSIGVTVNGVGAYDGCGCPTTTASGGWSTTDSETETGFGPILATADERVTVVVTFQSAKTSASVTGKASVTAPEPQAPLITITTSYDEGAMGGEPIGFTGSNFPPSSSFAWTVVDDNTLDGTPCAGNLATDANGNASIDNACAITFGPANQTVVVTYGGVTAAVNEPPAQPPPPTTTPTT